LVAALTIGFALSFSPRLAADDIAMISPAPPPDSGDERILGVIPNYQAVSNPDAPFVPLTVRQKWALVGRSSLDPFNAASAVLGAAMSQRENAHPRYGNGAIPYTQRFGAAMADLGMQSMFSAGVLASLLHQDPRYYRMGPRRNVLVRAGYSVSRLVVAKQDSGRPAFNASGVFGMGLGIAASNLYYPGPSRNGTVMAERIGTSFTAGAMGNLLSEFWPDIRTKVLSRLGPLKRLH
jgi:hypothetical protein